VYLFHYTSIDTLDKLLRSTTLKFNSINETNDPYESKIPDIYDIESEINDKSNLKHDLEKKINEIEDDIEVKQLEYKEVKCLGEKEKAEALKNETDLLESQLSYFKNKHAVTCCEYEKYRNRNYDKYCTKIEMEIESMELRYDEIKKNEGKKAAEAFKTKQLLPLEKKFNNYSIKFERTQMERYEKTRNGLVKIACFCSGDDFNITEFNDKNNHNRRQGFFHPRMWSQYAKNSSGCCIVFKKDKFEETYKKLSSEYYLYDYPVEYADLLCLEEKYKEINMEAYRDVSKNGIINHLKGNVQPLFFRKDKDWEDEKEYRFLLINKEQNRKRTPVFMNIKNTIDSIILGEKFNDSFEFISEKCKEEGIKLYKIRNDLGTYHLDSIE
jgi:hypothetical protein